MEGHAVVASLATSFKSLPLIAKLNFNVAISRGVSILSYRKSELLATVNKHCYCADVISRFCWKDIFQNTNVNVARMRSLQTEEAVT